MIHAVYKVTVEPTTEPVSLQSLKDAVRITTCDFDEELNRLLIAGRKQVENDSRRKLITQTLTMKADSWPVGRVFELRQPPVQSVTSITYLDTNEASQTLASSKYHVDANTTPPRIILDEVETWPNLSTDEPNAVTVTFVAGYGGASAVPVEAKLAIIEWVKIAWKGCEGSRRTYDDLINVLQWTAVGMVQ